MKNLLLLFILIVSISYQSKAQDLPAAWKLSEDGRRLIAGGENQGGFFSPDQIQEVQLSFAQANWWNLLEANYDSGTDLLATCWINGVQYDSVGVRFKGATSYRRNNTDKKSFNITLDYIIDGQDIEGYNTFNLNCGWDDNSSMKEVLYNTLGYRYYMGLKSNYANLSINGQYWGPYQSVQQFDSDYIKEWYLSNNGTIWRAERTAGTTGGGGGGGRPNFGAGRSSLNYNGPDSSDYNTDYTLKRTEQADPWAGLIAACDVLNNEPLISLEEELSKVLDIDKTCWYLAHEVIFSDDDSYINKGGSDYYVYFEAETGRIIPMEYDGNSVLGANNLNWDLFYRENETDFPLMNRFLSIPSIRQRYLAHVRSILEDYFTSSYADPLIDDWAAMIDSSVQADPKKFYTYSEYQSALNSLKQSIVTRRNFLLNDAELTNINPLSIDQVSYSVNGQNWQAPTSTEEVDVQSLISGSSGVSSVWLYYGESLSGSFEKIEMFDDGLHNDGAAADGQYGASIPPMSLGTYVRFYVEAIANDAASTKSYEPKGAEHDVYIYQVLTESATDKPIVINELMAQNDAAVADSAGDYDDWLELYNTSGTSVDLSGWSLSDDINELDKYVFPSGSILDADSYLVIWADEDLDQGDFHADFKLSADGESLYLSNNMQELVDVVNFPSTNADMAYARLPNGSGPFIFQAHTIGQFNGSANSATDLDPELDFKLYPNPASDFIRLEFEVGNEKLYTLKIYSISGKVLYESHDLLSADIIIGLSGFAQGIYVIQVELEDRLFSKKFIKQ
ncbi:MAG: CotH kinase family protein [Bacteroidia bacterium]|nr:CotH kinase family protein [Bacteroidia bacterium]